MNKKVEVKVFGIKINSPHGECSCGSCCDSEKPIGLLYREFIQAINNSDIKEYVDIKFIDLRTDISDGYSMIKYIIDKKFGIPLITINGELKLYGGISNNIIYQEIKRLLSYI